MLSRYLVSQVKHNSYFLAGLVLGLWVALALVPLEPETATCAPPAPHDEYQPVHERRAGGATAGRSVTRPRYYSAELGVRGPLLAGVLTGADALTTRAPALNRTAAALLPALKFFIAASAPLPKGLSNVVGFTDAREMLKPFHALKYLADNYLEEYDFFFLVSDETYVNARRLSELVSQLSVSQDVYMGEVADDDTHYCTLEGGILLSNSVLRAVHAELDWCVRNSYSPHHHENIGRCVLHASHLPCQRGARAQSYHAAVLPPSDAPNAALADAVTVRPAPDAARLYLLHAFLSRVHLERDAGAVRATRARGWARARRLPTGFRNASWPGGLRADAGLAPPAPDSRFDVSRWVAINESHALLAADRAALRPHAPAHARALQLVLRATGAWATRRWGSEGAMRLLEGAWRWEPATALRYRLLLEHTATNKLHLVEVSRVLGTARLAAVPYVTESARVRLVVPLRVADAPRAAVALRRHAALCTRDANAELVPVVVEEPGAEDAAVAALRALAGPTALHAVSEESGARSVGRAAARVVARRGPADALLVLTPLHVELGEEALNRARMNAIPGVQWFLAGAFSRHAQYRHPRFKDAAGNKPQVDTGRFNLHHNDVVAFYAKDFNDAETAWAAAGGARDVGVADVLTAAPLHALSAPEPGAVRQPAPRPPCAAAALGAECLRAHSSAHFAELDLGAGSALARLLLELEADREAAQ